jgi:hypothetical protein
MRQAAAGTYTLWAGRFTGCIARRQTWQGAPRLVDFLEDSLSRVSAGYQVQLTTGHLSLTTGHRSLTTDSHIPATGHQPLVTGH